MSGDSTALCKAIYLAWTGRRATDAELAEWAENPSQLELEHKLSKLPGAKNSPMWICNADKYQDATERMGGNDETIRAAIVLGSTVAAYESWLIARPEYKESRDYKTRFYGFYEMYRRLKEDGK